MNYTLHLTDNCNMKCGYCYVKKDKNRYMTFDTAKLVVDRAVSEGKEYISIGFFGGEPLLCKPLIKKIVSYANTLSKNKKLTIHYKMTTNGMLLDNNFLEFSRNNNIFIALSHDGIKQSHDLLRIDLTGKGTFDIVDKAAEQLLSYNPYAPVMMTINKVTVKYFYENVSYLFNKGFKYLICTLNYTDSWDEDSFKVLKREYGKIAKLYYELTMKEEKFYFSPFDVKIASHINQSTYCEERCELGRKQVSVDTDGTIYPCIQFVGESKWAIGNVNDGIDTKRQMELYLNNEDEKQSCEGCAISKRCNHYCGCLNKQTTGSINKVSPVLCAHERMVLPIADKLAEKLYKKRNGIFIHKHYNDLYPLISYLEDKEYKSSH